MYKNSQTINISTIEPKLKIHELWVEDEKTITSLIISYYNWGVEFNYINDKPESLKFYKLAYDLALKELGPNAYLSITLSERIGKAQSDWAASTNPSEKDIRFQNNKRISNLKKRIFKTASRKRKLVSSKKRKNMNLSNLLGDSLRSISKYPKSKDDGTRPSSQMSDIFETQRSNFTKYLNNSRNYNNSFMNSEGR